MVVLPEKHLNSLRERVPWRKQMIERKLCFNKFSSNLVKSNLKTFFKVFPEALKEQVFSKTPQDTTQMLLVSAGFKSFVFSSLKKETTKIFLQIYISILLSQTKLLHVPSHINFFPL